MAAEGPSEVDRAVVDLLLTQFREAERLRFQHLKDLDEKTRNNLAFATVLTGALALVVPDGFRDSVVDSSWVQVAAGSYGLVLIVVFFLGAAASLMLPIGVVPGPDLLRNEERKAERNGFTTYFVKEAIANAIADDFKSARSDIQGKERWVNWMTKSVVLLAAAFAFLLICVFAELGGTHALPVQ